ncbi:unnamed protein product [Oncorhynchus mykiss]|uniref:Tetratricopeptide repeat protein 7 N-terminal domain-containing protein n=1 Tax=Oncorhynchus mykiss TaxID=8022 RepID=A0A060WGW5_ONCMY|nr:unnamed protein product [Oncorhynchus mykiss]
MCEQSYWSPLEDPPSQSPLDDPLLRQGAPYTKDYALSRRPRVYSGENLFCPQENTEEALLLLLISESMVRLHTHTHTHILSLYPGMLLIFVLQCLERAMKFAFEEFHLWYQLALSLMAAGKSARAVKVLKECIRLKPDDPTIPLLAVKLCIGALHWLEEGECFAKMVVDMGEKASEFRAKGYLAIGLVYSLKATDASLRGMQEEYQRKALGAFQRLWQCFTSPVLQYPQLYTCFIVALDKHTSIQLIPEALGYVRQALQLQGDDVHSLHLLALLLSAQKHYHDALNIIEMALSEYPESFILLFTKVKLETLCRGPEEALLTCKHMLQIWKSCYNLTNPSDSGRGSSLLDRAIADRRTLNAMTLPDFSDPETGSPPDANFHQYHGFYSMFSVFNVSIRHHQPTCLSLCLSVLLKSVSHPPCVDHTGGLSTPNSIFHQLQSQISWPSLYSYSQVIVCLYVWICESVVCKDNRQLIAAILVTLPVTSSVHATSMAASRVEQALSEVASSMQSSAPKHGPLHPWMTLAQIWLHAAEVYIGMGKPAEATACTQEAANLFPMSHNVLFMRGQVAELRGNVDEAKRWYEEALSISPTHVKTMQRLVSVSSVPLFSVSRYLSLHHQPHPRQDDAETGES